MELCSQRTGGDRFGGGGGWGGRHDGALFLDAAIAGPGRGAARGVEQDTALVVEFQQRQRTAGHFHRGHEVAGPGALDANAAGAEIVQRATDDHRQFHRRGAAEAVDHQGHAVARLEVEIGADGVEQLCGDLVGTTMRATRHALFAVDAEAEFDLVGAELEARDTGGGNDDGAEADAHRADVLGGAAGNVGDLGEREAGSGGGAGELVHQHGAGNAAASPLGHEIAQRHVVGDDHDFDRDALLAGEFGGEAEVQPVAGIVLDDQHGTGRAGNGEDRGEHGVGGGRGEDVAGNGGRQHAFAHIAGMRRLMAAAAAREDGDRALGRFGEGAADDDILVGQQRHGGIEVGDAFEQLADEVARFVDEFFH